MSSIGKRILLVDDDEQLVALLCMRLSQAGFVVESATNADEGFRLASHNDFDIIILDLSMPRRSGLDVCRCLRAEGVLTPILILSGNIDKTTVVRGLNAGADDYLTKPFSADELMARINALLRRNGRAFSSEVIQCYDVVLDIPAYALRTSKASVSLTGKEILLLKRLMSEAPKPVPRLTLLQDVWGIGSGNSSNRVDVYIRRLRMKLRALHGGCCIRTIRGGGYYFDKV